MMLALALMAAFAAPSAHAEILGTDETRAGMCDAYDGLPFVFCVAMCEARECDRLGPSDERCEVLAAGFAAVTNGAAAPCSRPSRGGI
ncbi:MAG: hypothetical protein IT293_02950 [Deltaproteobacteria bacterium]|nr:hypothetical protein [Deltaproteobacteria bacterium]